MLFENAAIAEAGGPAAREILRVPLSVPRPARSGGGGGGSSGSRARGADARALLVLQTMSVAGGGRVQFVPG